MESEPSGRPDEMTFTQNALGWDDVLRHKEMRCGHFFHHSDTDSCDVERSFCETSDDQDVISSDEEQYDASKNNDQSAEDTCLSPSHVSRSLICFQPRRLKQRGLLQLVTLRS